ncbi:NADH:flavin oxidoreductase/NADH oxidase [Xylaria grammica]|nr:NADH:flavin oxidoreductase/NADH oxidase [Xylaria grammica]
MAPKRIPAPDVDPSPLGQPLHFDFSGRTAPNRFLKGAMTERLSSWDPKDLKKRGIPSKELINVYQRWGEGGLGLILTGNTMLYYDQLEAAGNPIIPKDASFSGERFERFKELGAKAKAHGSLVVGQLSHPGRQVPDTIQPNPLSASDIQLEGTVMGMTFGKPRAMDKSEIKDVVGSFAHAAEYLHRAGYDGVQLHGAHGYLIAQFLSQTTNKRTDEYGGSLLNRARLIFEIVDEIRKRVNDESFMIGIKLNSVEFQHGGFTPQECRDLCVELEKHSMDFVELSGGTYQQLGFEHKRDSTKKREAFFIEFAEMIVPQLKKTKVYVTGGLRTAAAMVEALKTVHGIGLARPVTHEFDLAKNLINGTAKSAIDYGIDEQDFGLSNIAAGTQIRLVGKGKEPLDLGRPDHKEAFDKALEQFRKDMADNTDGSKYGYMDIDGVTLEPYGTPYAVASTY